MKVIDLLNKIANGELLTLNVLNLMIIVGEKVVNGKLNLE